MVTLPPEFVATAYSGYFWNLKNSQLYSIKVSGILKSLKVSYPNKFNHFRHGYKVSVAGQPKFLDMIYLKKLVSKPSVIPVGE